MIKSKRNKRRKRFSTKPKLIITVSLMLALGTIFGLLSYLIQNSNKVTRYVVFYETNDEVNSQPSKEEAGEQDSGATVDIALQKYQNTDHGFEFSYPQGWELTRDLFSENLMIIVSKTLDVSENNTQIAIELLDEQGYDVLHKRPGKIISTNGIDAQIYEYSDGYEINFIRNPADEKDRLRKEYIRLDYQEVDGYGNKLSRQQWKNFDSMNDIVSSFIFIGQTNQF
jgi:hypothetical protein